MRSCKIFQIAALGVLMTYLLMRLLIVSFLCVFARLDTADFQPRQEWGAEEGKERSISDAAFGLTNAKTGRTNIQLLQK